MLYIRADANSYIATGHIMRCMAIANEFRKNGEEVTFILADHYACALLERNSYPYICLKSEWDNLDSEIDKMLELISKYSIKKLLIDTYYVTNKYLTILGEYTYTVYVDDLAKFCYPVHMLINYNIYADQIVYETDYQKNGTKMLLGCQYVPLRDEFKAVQDKVKKVFVSTGGSDRFNVAVKLLKFLTRYKSPDDVAFSVIVGSFNMHRKELQQLRDEHSNIELYENIDRISEVMQECDLAITAAGSTMYELCACKTPMITYTFADNQIEGAKSFEYHGIARYCGDVRKDENLIFEKICKAIFEYKDNKSMRLESIVKMGQLVDGKGVERVYTEMFNCVPLC